MVLAVLGEWEGVRQIYTVQANGENLTPIPADGLQPEQPRWSPDGTRLAFLSPSPENTPERFTFDLYTLRISDYQVDLVTANLVTTRDFRWSPDGKSIVLNVWSSDGSNGLFAIEIEDQSLQEIVPLDRYTTSIGLPSWSPDGKQFVFERSDDLRLLGYQIKTLRLDDKEIRTILPITIGQSFPQWNPIQDLLLFLSNDLKVYHQVFTMNADGTDRKQLTFSKEDKIIPEWSPNGLMIAYSQVVAQFEEDLEDNYSLHVMNWDGSSDQVVTSSKIGYYGYAWAPDNRHIAYLNAQSGHLDLYLADLCEGTNQILLQDVEHADLTWKPDDAR